MGIKDKMKNIKNLKLDNEKVKKAIHYFLAIIIGIAILSLLIELGLNFSNFYVLAKSPVTFSVLNFAGHLFFVVLPGEEIMFLYFLSTGINAWLVLALAVMTAIGAQAIDYFIGKTASTQIIDRLVKPQKLKIAESYVNRYGALVIFFFNLTPLSSPIMLLAAGILRYDFRKAMIWSLAGLTVKYVALIMFFKIFFY